VQQPLLRDQVAVVRVVERVRRGRVQRRVRAAPAAGRAAGPQRRREGRVDVGVVVDPGLVVLALRLPRRVGSCMHNATASRVSGDQRYVAVGGGGAGASCQAATAVRVEAQRGNW